MWAPAGKSYNHLYLFLFYSTCHIRRVCSNYIFHNEVRTCTVAPGDSLFVLARRHGVAYPAVVRANGLSNPNIIRAGRVLVLPTQYILPAVKENGVVINIPENRLFLFRAGKVRAVYPATVGLPTWKTAIGPFTVTSKVPKPTWYMPPELAERENVKREIVPPGPHNPLGDFWIGTSLKHTGIHSTNSPMTIGRSLSHGCIRLYPEHVKELFGEVTMGEAGEILYEPIKIAVNGDDVLVEIHPDIYSLVPDIPRVAEERLKALGVWEKVDAGLLRRAVTEARGMPVMVRSK
jgi:L,D-transpeptidase ErfK/SrfK